jgi:hypothetical protein
MAPASGVARSTGSMQTSRGGSSSALGGRNSSSSATTAVASSIVSTTRAATPDERAWAPEPPRCSLLMGTPVNWRTMCGPLTKA